MLKITLNNEDIVEIPKESLNHYKKTWEEIMTKAEQMGLSREEARAYEITKIDEI